MKALLRALGSLAAVAAVVAGFASMDFGGAAGGSGVHPMAGIAIAAGAFALIRASESWP
jgi:hypothetical protein